MPRTRSLAWSELKIGIIAVIAIGMAVMFVIAVGGQGGFSWEQYELITKFPDVKGLKSGAVVRVAGVEVGKVDEVKLTGSEVEVRLKVNEENKPRITDQSRATIGSLSLLGEPVIDILPSTQGRPAAGRRLPARGARPRPAGRRRRGGHPGAAAGHGDHAGHPRRKGHRRQAVHRRPDLPGGQRPHRLGRRRRQRARRAARARSA